MIGYNVASELELKITIPKCNSIVTVIANEDLLRNNTVSCTVHNTAHDITISFLEDCYDGLYEKIAEFIVYLSSDVDFWRHVIFEYHDMSTENRILKEKALEMIIVIVREML